MSRRLRITLRIVLGVLAPFVLLLALAALLLYTEIGTRAALALARPHLPPALSLGAVRGSVGRSLSIANLRYLDPDAGVDVSIGAIDLSLAPARLVAGELRVRALHVRDLAFTSTPPRAPPPPDEPAAPPADPPVDIVLEDFSLTRAVVRLADAEPVSVDRVTMAARWTAAGIAVERLGLDAPQGSLRAAGRGRLRAPWLEQLTAQVDWRQGEQRWRGSAIGRMRGDKLLAEVTVAAPFAAALEAEADRESLGLHGWLDLAGERIRIDELRARLGPDALELPVVRLRLDGQPGVLSANGRVRRAPPHAMAARIEWEPLDVPARWIGDALSTSGKLTVAGTLERFAAQLDADVRRAGRDTTVALRLAGSPRALDIRSLDLVQSQGRLAARGRIVFETRSWSLDAEARHLDPTAVAAEWPGDLAFDLHTTGTLDGPRSRATLALHQLSGTLRGRPLHGSGDLTLTPGPRVAGELRLTTGRTSLRVSSPPGRAAQVDVVLAVGALGEWDPALRGSVELEAQARGDWPATTVSASLDARDLRVGGQRLERAHLGLQARRLRDPQGELTFSAQGIAAAGMSFDEARLRVTGGRAAHTVELQVNGQPTSAALALTGALAPRTWSGSLDALEIETSDLPPLALESPARLELGAGRLGVSRACLRGGEVALCVAAQHEQGRASAAEYSLTALPLELLLRLAAPDAGFAVEGRLAGAGRFARAANGPWRGEANLGIPQGSIIEGKGEDALRFNFTDLALDANVGASNAHARFRATLERQGTATAEIAVEDPGGAARLSGNARANLQDLSPLTLLVPQIATLTGNARLVATFGGTLGAPRIAGGLELRGIAAELPELGIELGSGELDATLAEDGSLRATGKVSSGGTLAIRGTGASLDQLELAVEGRDFLAADIPGLQLVASPALTLSRKGSEILVGGSVTVPRADIDLSKLSSDAGEDLSPDVVVVDREEPDEAPALTVHAEVEMKLGDAVKLKGFGLDATVAGALSVREQPGQPGTGTGEIRLAGTYDAYGRKLTIERGRLQFASTPLDNPMLDILAIRKLPDVTAKLRVQGTARAPELSVFADPAKSQTDAMSYLLTGKPSSALRGEDGKMVQSAAQSLGGLLGDRVAKRVGGKIGFVDTVGVEQSPELGSSVFTMGKYLSPKLFISYGVGLFEPGSVMTVRYAISPRWSLEANQAPEDQRAGIHYRIER